MRTLTVFCREFTIQKRRYDFMDAKSIIDALDAEIEALRQARALLVSSGTSTVKKAGAQKPRKPAKRVLSPEARKRIADAQRKRWAAARKPKKAAAAAAPAKAAKKAASKKKPSEGTAKAAKKSGSAKAKKAAPRKAVPVKSEPPNTETVPS
jgi:hypothetical protein